MTTPEKKLETLDRGIQEAQKVIEVAKEVGQKELLEKAQLALAQFEQQKKELLESFSLERATQKTVAEEFKLNLGNDTPTNQEPTAEAEDYEDLPPHLRR